MQFPVELVPFEKWVAFRGDFPRGAGEHRMVIIQRVEDQVEYFYVTSYESTDEKHKIDLNNRKDIGSIAELSKNDWVALTKDSCVQCNLSHTHDISIAELRYGYQVGTIEYLGVIPSAVREKLIAATCASVSFTDTEKRLYTT